jgi:alpha-D-xyloside xylohydrolase
VPEKPDETVALYRYWATLHHELVPFFYSLAEEAYAGGPTVIRPVGDGPSTWSGDWRYQLGDALLVAPIIDDVGRRDVTLPTGARWFDWWDVTGAPLAGGEVLINVDATDTARVPLYVREGALVPLEVSSDVTGLGSAAHAGKLTLLAWPGATPSRFVVHEDPRVVEVTATGRSLRFSSLSRGAFVKLWTDEPPTSVSVDGRALTRHADKAALEAAGEGFTAAAGHFTWLAVPAGEGEHTVTW